MRTRVALFRAPGERLEVREIDVEVPGSEDVLVRLEAVGICGSDLHIVRGEWTRPVPMVLGHEGAGVVESVGDRVDGLVAGDRVVLSWAPACGECAPCRAGRPVACAALRAGVANGTLPDGTTGLSLEGEPVYRMTAVGALAERMVFPAKEALSLPSDFALDQAALIGCAALTGVGAVVNRADVRPGSSVLVVGAGGVGQFIVQGARLSAAAVIVAVDPIAARRDQALQLGATNVVEPEGVQTLLARVAPDGVDFAFDAVGGAEPSALALDSARGGGTVVLVGMASAGAVLEVNPFELTNEEKWLTGSLYGSEDPATALPKLIEQVQAGRLDLEHMLGPRFSLDEVNEAIEASLSGVAGRVLVEPGRRAA